jgi:hypothetical protein
VFPTAAIAAAIAATVNWLANFALIEIFPVWQNAQLPAPDRALQQH